MRTRNAHPPGWCNYCPLFKWSENETETLKTSKPMCCNSELACPSSALLSLPLRNREMHSALYRIALPERFRSSRRRDGGERKLCGCTLTVPRKASSRDRHFYESAAGGKNSWQGSRHCWEAAYALDWHRQLCCEEVVMKQTVRNLNSEEQWITGPVQYTKLNHLGHAWNALEIQVFLSSRPHYPTCMAKEEECLLVREDEP